ncbi:malate permease [[Mycoplasma] falconis]|uniref:Malate permease n=1 Tax=[Mycoplasma] falconis TaxID=92403 RepID=A0A501XBB9_9BACT|nr:AEC family transporter [[Mycoplasma] falconis]TPE57766.1 malate permease [[Mycoplasma] falconis]
MNPSRLFVGIITNTGLWGAIISTIVITLLGFLLFKFKVLDDHSTGAVQKVIINVIIPFLSFYSFLTTADGSDIKIYAIVFGLSAVYYIVLTGIAMVWVKLLPKTVPKSVITKAQNDFEKWQNQTELTNKQLFNSSIYLESLQKKHLVTWLMCIYGSNILFATPIVLGVYPNGIELGSLSIWNILYYIGGFGLSFSLISGAKFTRKEFGKTMKKTLLNPSFIVVLIAILLWSSQYFIPHAGPTVTTLDKPIEIQVQYGIDPNTKEVLQTGVLVDRFSTFGPNFSTLYGHAVTPHENPSDVTHPIVEWFSFDKVKNAYVIYNGKPAGWFDWKVTVPYLYKPISILASLISPLIWIVIGTSLAKTNIKEMFCKWRNWLFLIFKMVLIPIFILVLMIPLVITKNLPPQVAAVLVMTGSVPPGTTVVIYSQHFKVHEKYTAQVSSLSTMLSFIFIPVWLVVGVVVFELLAV